MFENLKFKYYKSSIGRDNLIEGIKTLPNVEQKKELIKEYMKFGNFSDLYRHGDIKNLDRYIIELSQSGDPVTFNEYDFSFLEKAGKHDVILELYRNHSVEGSIRILKVTEVYNKEILNKVTINNNLEYLSDLYERTNDDNIINVIFENAGKLDLFQVYDCFHSLINSTQNQRLLSLIISKEDYVKLYNNSFKFKTDDLLYMTDVILNIIANPFVAIMIINKGAYKKENIDKLINLICNGKKIREVYQLLTYNEDFHFKYDLTNEQKEKLEKELRESGNVTLNICYNYYKDKESFIKKTGGLHKIVACLIALNEYDGKLIPELEDDYNKYCNDSRDEMIEQNLIFSDDAKPKIVKVVKKSKKNLKK